MQNNFQEILQKFECFIYILQSLRLNKIAISFKVNTSVFATLWEIVFVYVMPGMITLMQSTYKLNAEHAVSIYFPWILRFCFS